MNWTWPHGLAFSEDDPRLAPLLDLAASRGTTLVVGAPVRIGPALHIGAFILSPDRTTGLYTKHRLGAFPPEAGATVATAPSLHRSRAVFRPGDRDPLIRFGENTAAVAVCADIGSPTHPQRAANRGADTYLASMFVIPSDYEGEVSKLSRYASQHRMTDSAGQFRRAVGGPPVGGPQCRLVRGRRTAGSIGSGRLRHRRGDGGPGRTPLPSGHAQRPRTEVTPD